MALRYFFVGDISSSSVQLDEDTSKHIVGVLRMEKGDELLLTNGKGDQATATIVDDNRKRCLVQVSSVEKIEEQRPTITIGISIIKNASRFEWFLEKATEIGVNQIIPLLCERTEKEKFRYDRMQGILISAMLQSQQAWLPVLHQPTEFSDVVKRDDGQKLIAHCLPEQKLSLTNQPINQSTDQLILIGPEGDFTEKEISLALQHDFLPVMLGATRLRTETAGIVAATLLKIR